MYLNNCIYLTYTYIYIYTTHIAFKSINKLILNNILNYYYYYYCYHPDIINTFL